MEPAASRPSTVMQHNIRSTESHELPEASFWRSADTRHCRSAFVCLWRLCQVGICKSAGERENRTRELEEPVSGPSRRPALEAPQPQTGGGDQRENERTAREHGRNQRAALHDVWPLRCLSSRPGRTREKTRERSERTGETSERPDTTSGLRGV